MSKNSKGMFKRVLGIALGVGVVFAGVFGIVKCATNQGDADSDEKIHNHATAFIVNEQEAITECVHQAEDGGYVYNVEEQDLGYDSIGYYDEKTNEIKDFDKDATDNEKAALLTEGTTYDVNGYTEAFKDELNRLVDTLSADEIAALENTAKADARLMYEDAGFRDIVLNSSKSELKDALIEYAQPEDALTNLTNINSQNEIAKQIYVDAFVAEAEAIRTEARTITYNNWHDYASDAVTADISFDTTIYASQEDLEAAIKSALCNALKSGNTTIYTKTLEDGTELYGDKDDFNFEFADSIINKVIEEYNLSVQAKDEDNKKDENVAPTPVSSVLNADALFINTDYGYYIAKALYEDGKASTVSAERIAYSIADQLNKNFANCTDAGYKKIATNGSLSKDSSGNYVFSITYQGKSYTSFTANNFIGEVANQYQAVKDQAAAQAKADAAAKAEEDNKKEQENNTNDNNTDKTDTKTDDTKEDPTPIVTPDDPSDDTKDDNNEDNNTDVTPVDPTPVTPDDPSNDPDTPVIDDEPTIEYQGTEIENTAVTIGKTTYDLKDIASALTGATITKVNYGVVSSVSYNQTYYSDEYKIALYAYDANGTEYTVTLYTTVSNPNKVSMTNEDVVKMAMIATQNQMKANSYFVNQGVEIAVGTTYEAMYGKVRQATQGDLSK